jgi:hypothetical protein
MLKQKFNPNLKILIQSIKTKTLMQTLNPKLECDAHL